MNKDSELLIFIGLLLVIVGLNVFVFMAIRALCNLVGL